MYSLLLETYIKDPKEKSRLFHAIDNIPAIQRKAEWAMKWIQRSVFVLVKCKNLLLLSVFHCCCWLFQQVLALSH